MAAKINLSDQEQALMQNREWILTKQQITEKIYDLLGEQVPVIESALSGLHMQVPDWQRVSAKIYRGESYRRFPYVMLDYPRLYTGEDALAIRTLFWWGHYLSVSLQLSGKYKRLFTEQDGTRAEASSWVLWASESPWEHDLDAFAVVEWNKAHKEECSRLIRQQSFIKLTTRISLENPAVWETQLEESYRQIARWISCPNGETVL
jgi:hypothetical protein